MPGSAEKSGIVPWHMWGAQQTVSISSDGGLLSVAEQQIVRVSYGRPETWGFVLAAQIVEQRGQVTNGTIATVRYDLTLGVGRASVTIPDWHVFTWDYGGLNPAGQLLWTNTVGNRIASTGVLGPPEVTRYSTTSWINSIEAQDIQLKARVGLDSAGENTFAAIAVHAYFAPLSHVRPEWFVHRFPGNEERGT